MEKVRTRESESNFLEIVNHRQQEVTYIFSRFSFPTNTFFELIEFANRQNLQIRETEPLHEVNGVPIHSEKLKISCAIARNKIFGTYLFDDATVIRENYKNILEIYARPRFNKPIFSFFFQRDSTTPHV